MSEALAQILPYVCAFYEGIDRCRSTTFNAADCEDAYNRLNRLRERYLHEKSHLDPAEAQALRKVFENDDFIKGMLDGRQIGEHVQKRSGGGPVIRLRNGSQIPLCVETSAYPFFAGPIVMVRDGQGRIFYVNHLEQLEMAEKRVRQALEFAKKS